MSSPSIFKFELEENPKRPKRDLIRLVPYGISLHPDPQRPILILKDETGDRTLPVALNPLEAGVTLNQFQQQGGATPHKVTELILQSLDVKIKRCVFVEIKSHFQYVRLHLENHPKLRTLKLRADEAMSLCLHLSVEIYATPEFMLASREMNLSALMMKAKNPADRANGQGYLQ